MAGGIDQTMATAILAALNPSSATKTIGTVTITFPLHLRLFTANGTDATTGTEQGTSGGYTAGGAAIGMGTAATGSIASNATVSWTAMPTCTLTGCEKWDTSGTPLREFWAPWTAGSIAVASGNTFTVSSGSYTEAIS